VTTRLKYTIPAGLLLALPGAAAAAESAVAARFKWLTFLVFGAIIGLTMFVTYLAAKRVKSASEFYAAGRSVTGVQNGWAIAGDYLSAASFLGIAGLISLYGYDGFMCSVGWLVAYITVLLVIRRAVPEHRQVHPRRHPRLPQRSEDCQDPRCDLDHHRFHLLPDRPDGG
jgi:Sodium:solute symporter family